MKLLKTLAVEQTKKEDKIMKNEKTTNKIVKYLKHWNTFQSVSISDEKEAKNWNKHITNEKVEALEPELYGLVSGAVDVYEECLQYNDTYDILPISTKEHLNDIASYFQQK